jgi:malate dehydrogenase (oxaloacetate-decarboxylating)
MDEWEVYPREAVAVGMQAIKEGVARIKMDKDKLYETASSIIRRARETTKLLMRENVIAPPPPESTEKE